MKTLAHRNIPITIIGGGIHGVSIALRLLREVPTAANRLAIVDRHPLPLTQWRHKTERQGWSASVPPPFIILRQTHSVLLNMQNATTEQMSWHPPLMRSLPRNSFWDFCTGYPPHP